jgi:mono/diheme cytochrome c family protein
MKKIKALSTVIILVAIIFTGCGDKKKPSADDFKLDESKMSPLDTKISEGKKIYEKTCQACHQADGKGVEGAFPPLAASDFFATDKLLMVSNIVNGISGEITVNGKKYNTPMPKQVVADEEAANVATYVLNAFGNTGGEVSVEEVKSVKK